MKNRIKPIIATGLKLWFACTLLLFSHVANASESGKENTNKRAGQLSVAFSVPKLNVSPYHRPYVAVWVETESRQHVATLALWKQLKKGDKWLKDLRQFWRKKKQRNADKVDAVTSATKRPGSYTFNWDLTDDNQQPVPAGKYLLNIEVVREEGGRDFHRIPLDLSLPPLKPIKLPAKKEIGAVSISLLNPTR